MEVDTFGDGEDLVWVMGWGNRADGRHERWFVDALVEAGYRVHAVELPTNGSDFESDYLAPVRQYRQEVGDHRLVSHSMGGLVVAHLRPAEPVTYLSPWWGMLEDAPPAAMLLFRLPTSRRIIPRPFDAAALGGLATEDDDTAPGWLSPNWIRTMLAAQADLPPIDREDVVFYSPRDRVVSVDAIERHADRRQRETYDGGHELFASEGRADHVERVLDALADAGT